MADNEETVQTQPEYTPIRISQLARVEEYKGTDRLLLARQRGGEGVNAAYTTVTQAISSLSNQVYNEAMERLSRV